MIPAGREKKRPFGAASLFSPPWPVLSGRRGRVYDKAMIDLHIHSTASDGTDSPSDIVARAIDKGLSAIALTDHNTMDGVAEAFAAAGDRLSVIPGVELNAALPHPGCSRSALHGSAHVIGLFPWGTTTDGAVAAYSRRERAKADERNLELTEKLRARGYPVDHRDVLDRPSEGAAQICHYLSLLCESGLCRDKREASALVKEGGPCHVPLRRASVREAALAIRADRGMAVLAHPYSLGLPDRELFLVLSDLAGDIDGVEAWYSRHSREYRRSVAAMTYSLGLLATGGSDFHGLSKRPDCDLGTGPEGEGIPDEIIDHMTRRTR